jgi:hypothetical protein
MSEGKMTLSDTQIGILRDIAANKVSLDDCGKWMVDQLVELVFHEPMLIDTVGPSVFLTEAGSAVLTRETQEGGT